MTKTDFDKKLTSFNWKISSNKTIQKKLNSLITKDCNFFLGRIYFIRNDRSQKTFVYQPNLDSLELKKYEGTDYVLSLKSNGAYNSKLKPLCTAFLHNIKISGYKMGIKSNEDPSAVE